MQEILVRPINSKSNICKTCKQHKCKCKFKSLVKLSNNVTITFVSKKEKKLIKQPENETKGIENKTEPVEIPLNEKDKETTTELIEKQPLISKTQKIHECPICQETFGRVSSFLN